MYENFYYVYILRSLKDKLFYTGTTSNLEQRIEFHNNGLVNSTKKRIPFELIFYEAYINKYDAFRREKYLKSTKGKTTLRYMLKEFLKHTC